MAKKAMIKVRKQAPDEVIETAPLEAYAPMSLVVQDKDYIIRACDGDHEYVYLAFYKEQRGKAFYQVVEAYPGLSAKHTNVRDAFDQKDLVLTDKCDSIELAVNTIRDILFADFEVAPAPGNVRLLAAVNS
jgi:hypothetical protein